MSTSQEGPGQYRIEIGVNGLPPESKVHYNVEAATLEQAKAEAYALWLKEVLPQLVAVSWEGPIAVLRAESIGTPEPAADTPPTS